MKKFVGFLSTFLLAFPESIFAQGSPPKIAIGDVKLPVEWVEKQSQFVTEISSAFLRENKVRLVPRNEIDAFKDIFGSGENRSDQDLKEARTLLAQGKKMYQELKPDKAVSFLDESQRQFILHFEQLRSNRELLDAVLYLGLSYFALKKKDLAEESFQKLLTLDPTRTISTSDFPPSAVNFFNQARKKMPQRDLVRFRVESEPPGANLYMNGKLSGRTPIELRVPAGEVFVLVEKQGLKPWFKPVSLKQLLEPLSLTLTPSKADSSWSELFSVREKVKPQDEEKIGRLSALGDRTGAQAIFLSEVDTRNGTHLLGQWFDVRTHDFSKVVSVSIDSNLKDLSSDASDLSKELLSQLRPDGYVIPGGNPNLEFTPREMTVGGENPNDQVTLVAPPKEQTLWYKNGWIWGGVAVFAVGLFFGVRAISGSSGGIVVHNQGNF